ncbi:glycosyltransferase [Leeuwenhoekiella sp. CH_XMU1409-2]|uniref:glycosyltransferase n=1 Tax=Leeuwenhoekiella sp. CH_XMU1409-2 TaxID=3107768 RepID=UPI0030088D4B
MKILRVIVTMNPSYGGPCQGIRNSVPALRNLGIDTEVLSVDDPESDFLGNDDFLIHAVGPSRTKYSFTFKQDLWLKDNLHRYEAVLIHGLWQYSSYGAYKVWSSLKKKGVSVPPMYIMPHGMLDPYFQKASDRKLKAFRNRIFWRLFEKSSVNGVSGILFTCEQELILARNTFTDYKPKAEINVGYGIQEPPSLNQAQVNAFYKACPTLKKKPYWLFLSRIHPKKGVDNLIEAYKILKSKRKSIPDLVIAGPGMNTDFGEKLLRLTNTETQIHFPGMLQGAAKWGAFYECEAFVLTSHQENFGIAVVEAMACAKPVLISNQINIWREIADGGAGLVESDSVAGAVKLFERWSNMASGEREKMGENAYRTYIDKFTTQAFANNLMEVFQE